MYGVTYLQKDIFKVEKERGDLYVQLSCFGPNKTIPLSCVII